MELSLFLYTLVLTMILKNMVQRLLLKVVYICIRYKLYDILSTVWCSIQTYLVCNSGAQNCPGKKCLIIILEYYQSTKSMLTVMTNSRETAAYFY